MAFSVVYVTSLVLSKDFQPKFCMNLAFPPGATDSVAWKDDELERTCLEVVVAYCKIMSHYFRARWCSDNAL